jgi:hypothetical protein
MLKPFIIYFDPNFKIDLLEGTVHFESQLVSFFKTHKESEPTDVIRKKKFTLHPSELATKLTGTEFEDTPGGWRRYTWSVTQQTNLWWVVLKEEILDLTYGINKIKTSSFEYVSFGEPISPNRTFLEQTPSLNDTSDIILVEINQVTQ